MTPCETGYDVELLDFKLTSLENTVTHIVRPVSLFQHEERTKRTGGLRKNRKKKRDNPLDLKKSRSSYNNSSYESQ
jgi:hypothetical protein